MKHLTELHGGTVEVVSGGVGAGTMLKLRIPAIAAADAPQLTRQAREARRRVVHPPRALDGVRVWAVYDEPEMRALLQAVLDTSGAQTKVVESVARTR